MSYSMKPKRDKSLQELENSDWGDPASDDTYLVTTCKDLRRVPLKNLGTEDLRILIGQNIGLPFLIPLALERLSSKPLAEGDFYPGDLLVKVLMSESAFWENHSDYCEEVHKIVRPLLLMGQKKKKRFCDSIEAVKSAYQHFQAQIK